MTDELLGGALDEETLEDELFTELDETLLLDLTDELLGGALDEDTLLLDLTDELLDEEAAVSFMQRTGKYTSLPEKLETDTPDPS